MKCEKIQTVSKIEQVSKSQFQILGEKNQLAQFGPGILPSSNQLWPNRQDHMVRKGRKESGKEERQRSTGVLELEI